MAQEKNEFPASYPPDAVTRTANNVRCRLVQMAEKPTKSAMS
jgi:hypothetical protein